MPPRRLLITDLDNTLYDWVGFFAPAFRAMVDELALVLGVEDDRLLEEFKSVHQRLGSLEQPFAIFEIESVKRRYPGASPAELAKALDRPLHRFNSIRKQHLRLYPGVARSLWRLSEAGVRLVGHTEASAANAYYRLSRLGIAEHFAHLYTQSAPEVAHPDPVRQLALAPPAGLVVALDKSQAKPNPRLLEAICGSEDVAVEDAVFVGDSLAKDVAMAKAARVRAVWARYGTDVDPSLWEILVRVTHWTDADVAREASARRDAVGITPDDTIDRFDDILEVFGLDPEPVGS